MFVFFSIDMKDIVPFVQLFIFYEKNIGREVSSEEEK